MVATPEITLGSCLVAILVIIIVVLFLQFFFEFILAFFPAIVVAVVVYLLTGSAILTAVAFVAAALLFGTYGSRRRTQPT